MKEIKRTEVFAIRTNPETKAYCLKHNNEIRARLESLARNEEVRPINKEGTK